MLIDTADKPFWLRCSKCRHCWPAAYYPMEATKFCRVMSDARHCPKCGVTSKHIMIAKQQSGQLIEIVDQSLRRFQEH